MSNTRIGHPRPYKVRVLRQWQSEHRSFRNSPLQGKWYPTKGARSYIDQGQAVEAARELAQAGYRTRVYYGYPSQPGVIAGGRYMINEAVASQFPTPEWIVVTINPDGEEEWAEPGTTEERLMV